MKKICINIESEYKGFLLKLAERLQKQNDIKIITTKSQIIDKLKNKNYFKKYVLLKNRNFLEISEKDLLEKCKKIEKNFNFTFSDLITRYRDLGQSYLFNVDKAPKIKKSKINYKLKLNYVFNHFVQLENAIKNYDILIKIKPDYLSYLISKKYRIKYLNISAARYGNRFFWNDNFFIESNKFIKNISNNLKNINNIDLSNVDQLNLKSHQFSKKLIKVDDIKLITTLKKYFIIIINNFKKLIRLNYDFNSYSFFSWPNSEIVKYLNFKFLNKISKDKNFLITNKYVYFPLHLEPEIALLEQGSYLNNSLEIISWISKTLPVDVALVIKENPLSLSVRSKDYYKKINSLNNVYLADLKIDGNFLIQNSLCVANILGTTGYETINNLKPLLLFNKFSILNRFSTVFNCDSFHTTKNAINFILENKIEKNSFLVSKKILIESQINSSFELNNFEKYIGSYDCSEEILDKSIYHLNEIINE
tara:strand:- start:7129 stop:8562 length:1434 start_codon:yes stop_codon:yes gene_type:complete